MTAKDFKRIRELLDKSSHKIDDEWCQKNQDKIALIFKAIAEVKDLLPEEKKG